MSNISVLFLIFNRPEKTRRVFETIARAKPSRLFIAADGPRATVPEDMENCKFTREIVSNVDWDCEVITLFREQNLGCKIAVSSAIDWFFEQVEEGIILEDDCLPSDSFFSYCAELLAKYRAEPRVMMISGCRLLDPSPEPLSASYYFSSFCPVWGWASWRRAWKLYDIRLTALPELIRSGEFDTFHPDRDVRDYFLKCFIPTYKGEVGTWDFQWMFALLANHGLSIRPAVNLVENIGFDSDATHTSEGSDCFRKSAGKLGQLVHPVSIACDEAADMIEYIGTYNVKHRDHSSNIISRWVKLFNKRRKAQKFCRKFLTRNP